jgi:hypothetical protein
MDLARAPRRARLTARKKGSGYENGVCPDVVIPGGDGGGGGGGRGVREKY